MKNFRLWLLAAMILVITLFASALIWNGYAGLEGPPGLKLIQRPYLQGTLVALFIPAKPPLDPSCPASCPPSCPYSCLDKPPQAVFAFTGECKRTNHPGGPQPVELGPIIADEFPADFFQPEFLEGFFFGAQTPGVPPCFAESGTIVGYVFTKVRRFTALGPTVFIADVDISAAQ